MENAIIIIHAADIPAAATLAKTLDDYVVYLFDPTLLDRISGSDLKNIRLQIWKNHLKHQALRNWANTAAFEIEKELDDAVGPIIPGVSICSWQQLSLNFILQIIKWYTCLWEEAFADLPDCKLHLFVCDRPGQIEEPSFIPALMLMQKLVANKIDFCAYNYGQTADDTRLIPNLFPPNDSEDFDLLVHIPTLFYDADFVNTELQATGKKILNIASKVWNIPTYANKTVGVINRDSLKEQLPESLLLTVSSFFDAAVQKLDELLKPHIFSPAYRSRQAKHLADTYTSQVMTYFMLEEYFKHGKPRKILLSAVNAGYHGPIFSFAQHNSIPVIMIPHSKASQDIEFDGTSVTMLAHPAQGELILDRSGKNVLTRTLAFPEIFTASTRRQGPIRSIGLLLNSISSSNGIYLSSYELCLDGIRKIYEWCKKNDIHLGIRCRPHEPLITIVASETGMDPAALNRSRSISLSDFAQEHDMCLMYGSPTSAALEYLRRGIPILNPVPESIYRTEGFIISDEIIPRKSVETTLDTLDTFVSDGKNLYMFKNRQFGIYISKFNDALPLRDFL